MENGQSVSLLRPGREEEEELPPRVVPSLCFCPSSAVCRKQVGGQGREQSVWQGECTCDLGRNRINQLRRAGEAKRVSEWRDLCPRSHRSRAELGHGGERDCRVRHRELHGGGWEPRAGCKRRQESSSGRGRVKRD